MDYPSVFMRYNVFMTKIAIIEDDQAIAQMYRMKFEAEGFVVETASNGLLGLQLTEEMRPDIVLLDVMMPDMPGDEMLAKMRSSDWGKTIKVVILTNRSEQEVTEAVRGFGVSAVIVKANMTPRQVTELIKGLL
jgi:DNA-binding response OmpR family regulator